MSGQQRLFLWLWCLWLIHKHRAMSHPKFLESLMTMLDRHRREALRPKSNIKGPLSVACLLYAITLNEAYREPCWQFSHCSVVLCLLKSCWACLQTFVSLTHLFIKILRVFPRILSPKREGRGRIGSRLLKGLPWKILILRQLVRKLHALSPQWETVRRKSLQLGDWGSMVSAEAFSMP